MMRWQETEQGLLFFIKVIPRAHANLLVDWENEELKVRVRAVPDKGLANEALVELLAKEFKVN